MSENEHGALPRRVCFRWVLGADELLPVELGALRNHVLSSVARTLGVRQGGLGTCYFAGMSSVLVPMISTSWALKLS